MPFSLCGKPCPSASSFSSSFRSQVNVSVLREAFPFTLSSEVSVFFSDVCFCVFPPTFILLTKLVMISVVVFTCFYKEFVFVWVQWRRKWQPTPVFLLVKSHGQKSLAGYNS